MKRILAALALTLASPALAAVSTGATRVGATATGSSQTINFTFPVYDRSHVEVYVCGGKLSAGYTVVLNSNQTATPGGAVTLSAPAGSAIVVQRTIPLRQVTTLDAYRPFPAKTVEKSFDTLLMQSQQVDRRVADAETTHAQDKLAQATIDVLQDVKWTNAVAALNGTSHAQSDLSSVLALGTTTARTLAARFADRRNAKDLGAKCDGVTDDAAAINAALAAIPTSIGGIVDLPAGVCIVGDTLNMPEGTTSMAVLRGQGVGSTIVKLKDGTNKDVISHASFADIGAGSGTARATDGVWHIAIEDLTVDGNKANNSSGRGIALYGKGFRIQNVVIQNAAGDGLFTEYDCNLTGNTCIGGDVAFNATTDTIEPMYMNVELIFNGGDGWKNYGPIDGSGYAISSWNNQGWGIRSFQSIVLHGTSTYLNVLGGIYTNAALQGSGVGATTATGPGLLIDWQAGNCNIHGSYSSMDPASAGLIVRSPNHLIVGSVSNSPLGVKLDGGSFVGTLLMMSNTTCFDVTSQNGFSNVKAYGTSACSTLFAGSPAGTWIVDGNKHWMQLGTTTLRAGGYTPTLPPTNGTLPATDTANNWTSPQTFGQNVEVVTPGYGYIIYTPNGTRRRIVVADDGTISAPVFAP